MKKKAAAAVVLLVIFLTVVVSPVCVLAVDDYPILGIAGLVKDVRTVEKNIHVEFADGRVIFFQGNYTGQAVEQGKRCVIFFQQKDQDVLFTQGIYVRQIYCTK